MVWAPLKLVLLVLEKRGRGFEKLAEKLDTLVDALPRYNIYSEHFRDNTILQRALGKLYVSYIDFCLRAARYWESDGLGMFPHVFFFSFRFLPFFGIWFGSVGNG